MIALLTIAAVAIVPATAGLAVLRSRVDPVASAIARPIDAPPPRPALRVPDRAGRVAGVVGACMAGSVVAGPPGAVAGAVVAAWLPVARRRRQRAREADLLEGQLSEAVETIAAALRAGLSLTQSVAAAAADAQPPLASTLGNVVRATSLGVPLADALHDWAAATPGQESRLVEAVLSVHHRAGGEAPRVLDDVARTLRERRSAAQEVRSLTAQARLSGAILGLLPVGFFLFLSITARQDVEAAYRSPAGAAAITLGFALQLAAFVWIRRLLRVEG